MALFIHKYSDLQLPYSNIRPCLDFSADYKFSSTPESSMQTLNYTKFTQNCPLTFTWSLSRLTLTCELTLSIMDWVKFGSQIPRFWTRTVFCNNYIRWKKKFFTNGNGTSFNYFFTEGLNHFLTLCVFYFL